MITPSLPTFFHRLGDHLADRLVALAEMVPTCATSSLDFWLAPLMVFDDGDDRLVDAALEVHRVHAGRDRLHALADDRLGEHGGVVVPSPATSLVLLATSRTIWAPMFSNLSASSISLATVTPSLVMRGAPKFVEHDIAALRAQRHLDGIGENVDAAQHALLGVAAEAGLLWLPLLIPFYGWMSVG